MVQVTQLYGSGMSTQKHRTLHVKVRMKLRSGLYIRTNLPRDLAFLILSIEIHSLFCTIQIFLFVRIQLDLSCKYFP